MRGIRAGSVWRGSEKDFEETKRGGEELMIFAWMCGRNKDNNAAWEGRIKVTASGAWADNSLGTRSRTRGLNPVGISC